MHTTSYWSWDLSILPLSLSGLSVTNSQLVANGLLVIVSVTVWRAYVADVILRD